jgi:prepilin-type N-terminal cleavage/methylation domain-containing protein
MENQKTKIKNQKFTRPYRSGFTMAELLIALMITGMLLAAIAFAFSASVKNFNDNREIFLAANKARQALTQIIPRLRTGQAFQTGLPDSECKFKDADGHWITYTSSDKKLYMQIDSGSSHVLCDNVENMTFTKSWGGTPPNTDVKSVIISITVKEGSISQRFDTAVVIRKNL